MRDCGGGMLNLLRRTVRALVPIGVMLCLWPAAAAWGAAPAQKLPSALLVFPLVEVDDAGGDTRVELVNLSGNNLQLQCFYVYGDSCTEIGFFLSLTPYQPVSWSANTGLNDTFTVSAVPPFFGTGEMKCAVVPPVPDADLDLYNALQGRATVFDSDGRTVSYSAIAFQRLSPGTFDGVLPLDGVTYAQCPDKLHFDLLADQPSGTPPSVSEMVLIPCQQDLLFQEPTTINVQYIIVNEFEQQFSTSIFVTCFEKIALSDISDSLRRTTLGSDTAHVIVRGGSGPLLGLVIDDVPFAGKTGTAGNEPSFSTGRSATVLFPY